MWPDLSRDAETFLYFLGALALAFALSPLLGGWRDE
jgi:hypothetical protein